MIFFRHKILHGWSSANSMNGNIILLAGSRVAPFHTTQIYHIAYTAVYFWLIFADIEYVSVSMVNSCVVAYMWLYMPMHVYVYVCIMQNMNLLFRISFVFSQCIVFHPATVPRLYSSYNCIVGAFTSLYIYTCSCCSILYYQLERLCYPFTCMGNYYLASRVHS